MLLRDIVIMRKRLKKKRYSCALCKPHKTGGGLRWKIKEFFQLKDFEQQKIGIH